MPSYSTVTNDGDVEQSPRGPGGGLDTSQEVPAGRTAKGVAVSQAIQWSSEYHDPELDLIYYNYRYYNPTDGRWTRRDPLGMESGVNLFNFCYNIPVLIIDNLGEKLDNPPPSSIPPANRPQPILKGTPKAKDMEVSGGKNEGSALVEVIEIERTLSELIFPSTIASLKNGMRICNKEKAANPNESADSCGCCIIVIANHTEWSGNVPYGVSSIVQVTYVYNTSCSKYNANRNSLFNQSTPVIRDLHDNEFIYDILYVPV